MNSKRSLKFLLPALCVGLVLAVSGCGDDSSDSSPEPSTTTTTAEDGPIVVGSPNAEPNTDAMVEAATKFCKQQGVEALAKQFKVDPSDVDAVVEAYVNFGFEKKFRKYGLEGCRAGLGLDP